MGFIIQKKSKAALQAVNKARKKGLEHQTAMCALASGAPDKLLPEMKLEKRPIASLKGLPKRVRKSDKEQVERVARSIRDLGQAAPILIDVSGEIIDGHVVVQALKELGQTNASCAVISHLNPDERALLHVTLNRIGELGDWDMEALGPLLVELDEVGFDLEVTGFSLPELDIIMSGPKETSEGAGDEELVEPPTTPVTIAGDLWLLDEHRVLCGDATDPGSYAAVLAAAKAQVIFTDCPWNIPIEGFVSGLGKTKHKDFAMAVGEMSEEQFAAFCDAFHKLAAQHLEEGGAFFSCIDWRSVHVIMAAARKAGLKHINTAVWNKGSGGMGAPYRSAHELVPVFVKGDKLKVNNVELGKHGRDRTNVWSYPGANRRGSSAAKALSHHPTPKPVEMVEDALKDVSKRGSLALDPFLGSGTTLLAAERSGRKACGIELDPAYVDVAISRWEELTGREAVHAESQLTFAEVAAERLAQSPKKAA